MARTQLALKTKTKLLASGATEISTVDNSATAANLTLDIDGDIELNADGGQVTIKDGTDSHFLFDCDNTRLRIYDDTNANHYFTLSVDTNGATTLGTSNVGTTAHMTLVPDGDLILDPASNKVIINATDDLYFDGGGDTYIEEGAADQLNIFVGGERAIQITEGSNICSTWFRESCAFFTKVAETFSDDSLITSGGTDDTHIDFRVTNKVSLAVTGDITNLNLIFPSGNIAGNFVLLLTYDGNHDITNWKAYEGDLSAASGDADVLWAGGSAMATTNAGTDIVSFFWDGAAQKCYAVGSTGFAN